jgi:hypothetical protein
VKHRERKKKKKKTVSCRKKKERRTAEIIKTANTKAENMSVELSNCENETEKKWINLLEKLKAVQKEMK